jgi:hypothetical protein
MNVGLSLNGGALASSAALFLAGPGDVTGLDPSAVLRTWPHADVFDAESNYLALVELAQADLPWRYTLTAPTGDRLQPWICLVVLRDDELSAPFTASTLDQALPVLTVKSTASLPRLDQAWAWAHVQANGASVDRAAASRLYATDPTQIVARLLCPRQLQPKTSYLAAIVPTLELARRAGLGQAIDATVGAMDAAWAAGQTAIQLPAYYSWRFQTGLGGDFESLVRQLVARPLPATVGTRDLDVSSPGPGLPAASPTPLKLGGALQVPPPRTPPSPPPPPVWQDADRQRWTAALGPVLDQPANRATGAVPTPIVTPPIYGQWQAGVSTLDGAPAGWLVDLNVDPTLRVAAGLGAQVVAEAQIPLVAAAWQQVDGIRRVNEELRFTQLAVEVATRLQTRHLPGDTEALLSMTAPVHSRVPTGAQTAQGALASSPVAPGALDPAYRRLARPMGPVAQRQARKLGTPTRYLTAMNQGTLRAAPPPTTSAAMATLPGALKAVGLTQLTGATVRGVTAAAAFAVAAAPPGSHVPTTTAPTALPPPPTPTPTSSAPFQTAAAAAVDSLTSVPPIRPALRSVSLPSVQGQVLQALDPQSSMVAATAARLNLPSGAPKTAAPVMAAPEFPQPMYAPLAALSQDWLLPGLAAVPENTVALAVTNQAFVEAYMVGLSTEMSRVLLWNEYPTDQRGTYFRQFWDMSGYVPPPGPPPAPDALADITPIATWPASAPLGGNRGSVAKSDVVLLVRGAIFQRYPDTLVYAVRAVSDGQGGRTLGTDEAHPLFRGSLGSDVSFFGFALDVKTVLGSGQGADLGYYFVLAEHPGAPRFGLETADPSTGAPTSWGDLAWPDLVADPTALASLTCIDLDADQPRPTIRDPEGVVWPTSSNAGAVGASAAGLAYITCREPFRIAVFASQMVAG